MDQAIINDPMRAIADDPVRYHKFLRDKAAARMAANAPAPAQEPAMGSDVPIATPGQEPTDQGAPGGGMEATFSGMGGADLGQARAGLAKGRQKAREAEDVQEGLSGMGYLDQLRGEKIAEERVDLAEDLEHDMTILHSERMEAVQSAQEQLNGYMRAYTNAANLEPDSALLAGERKAAVVATIVSGLGAIAQIFSRGGSNALAPVAQQIINRANKAIERDVRAKLARQERLKTSISLADKRLRDMRQHFDDKEAYVKYLSDLEFQRVVQPLLDQQMTSKNAQAQMAAKQLHLLKQAELSDSNAMKEASIAAMAQNQAQITLKAVSEARRPFSGLDPAMNREATQKWTDLKVASETAKEIVGLFDTVGDIDRFIGKFGYDSTEYRRLKSAANRLMRKVGDMGQALTDTEIEIMTDIIGDPTRWRADAGEVRKTLQDVLRGMETDLKAYVEGGGGQLNPRFRSQMSAGEAPPRASTPARRGTER